MNLERFPPDMLASLPDPIRTAAEAWPECCAAPRFNYNEACRKARKCTDECGIVAVDVARVRWARRPRPAKQARRKQR